MFERLKHIHDDLYIVAFLFPNLVYNNSTRTTCAVCELECIDKHENRVTFSSTDSKHVNEMFTEFHLQTTITYFSDIFNFAKGHTDLKEKIGCKLF